MREFQKNRMREVEKINQTVKVALESHMLSYALTVQ